MNLTTTKIIMSFPIVGWMSQKGHLWDAFDAGEKFFGNNAFCKGIKDIYCLQSQNNKNIIVGIDVPVLLSNGKGEKGTIMIIGESPVRDTRRINKNGIYIGTPFAVALKFDIPPQCNIYKYIFCNLLNEGYNVYITDAVKEWNDINKKIKIKDLDKTFLKDEIRNIKPILIVTWGETAKVACKKIFNNKTCFYHQTHPVNLNWDRWKVKMFKDTIKNKSVIGKNYIDDSREDKVKDPIYLSEFISQEILRQAKTPFKYQLP